MNSKDREAFEAWADNLPSGVELNSVEKNTAMYAWEAALAHRDALDKRLFDLVRNQRAALRHKGLIDDDEYVWLVDDDNAIERLATYEEVKDQLITITQQRDKAIEDYKLASKTLADWQIRSNCMEQQRDEMDRKFKTAVNGCRILDEVCEELHEKLAAAVKDADEIEQQLDELVRAVNKINPRTENWSRSTRRIKRSRSFNANAIEEASALAARIQATQPEEQTESPVSQARREWSDVLPLIEPHMEDGESIYETAIRIVSQYQSTHPQGLTSIES